ncbi:MAG: phosphoribosylformylglycinamidine cyclo-ligase [Lentisphaeria bacterium]|nr:phosphoribosylformylglycinamidine cyclo-ligase [Lentisphaeria bacterium]
MSTQGQSKAYRDAGVDIDLAQNLLQRVKAKISATRRPEALAPIGGFGGLFQLDLSKYRQPVLVASVDGVGTKLTVAAMMDKHDTVGFDIVNHCINDIAVQGAEPLYFLDYIGIGKLRSPLYEQVLEGAAEACRLQNVTLLGGETAEMPGMYGNDYDLVGSITGVVEKDRIITGDRIAPGHVAIGMASSGLHTNGYSLARRVLFAQAGLDVHDRPEGLGGCSLGEALLAPHVCYWPAIRAALAENLALDGLAHITGGGLYDNVPRVLPEGVAVRFDASAIPTPPIFRLIQECGQVDPYEMYRVFNMGAGMVWFVPAAAVDRALALIGESGFAAWVIGEVTPGAGKVTIDNVES